MSACLVLCLGAVAAAQAPWQLELDAPLGLRSLASAAGDSAEIAPSGGFRGAVAWSFLGRDVQRSPSSWVLALELAGRVALPDQRGTTLVRLDTQQAWLAVGGRGGYRAQSRGFVLEPFWSARLNGGARWRQIGVGDLEQQALQPLVGLGGGGGWIVGRERWRLRLDVGVDLDRRGLGFVSELAMGWVL
jgi:hypothetical protein